MIELEELLEEVRRNPSGWGASLRDRRDSLRPELADEARQFFLAALESGELQDAVRGAMLASLLYLWQGRRAEALTCRLDLIQLGFMAAATPEAYDDVRRQALDTLGQAEEAGEAEIGFQAAVLAADASFFASQATETPSQRTERVGQALHDVAQACRGWTGDHSLWFDRLISLLAETVRHSLEYGLSRFDEHRAELVEVARWADRNVPPDYDAGGDEEKADFVASILADLSHRVGSS